MINRRGLLLGIPAIATGLAACSRISDIVRIGVAQPLSGPLAALGTDMLNGVKLAIGELNQTGVKIDDRRVTLELLSADDKADPEAGRVAAQHLIDGGAAAVIGHLNSGVSIAAAPLYAKHMIPQLAISTKPEFTQLGLPTTLRLVANDTMQAKALGSFAADLDGATSFAIVDDGTPFGQGLARAVGIELRNRGKRISVQKTYDQKTTDFSALMAALKPTDADVIVTTLSAFQVVAMANQLAAAGLQAMRVVGADPLKTDEPLASPVPIRAMYATSPIVEAREFLQGRAFLSRFRRAFGGDPVYAAHYAYDAVFVLVEAMRKARAAGGEALVRALKRVDAYAPVTSSMRFDDHGEQRYGAIGVYLVRSGGWQVVARSDSW